MTKHEKFISLLRKAQKAMEQYVMEEELEYKTCVTSPRELYELMLPFYSHEQEVFVVVGLDGAHKPVFSKEVTRGLVNRTLAHPREVFADAVANRCVAIAIGHNHPSGNLTMSNEDIAVTKTCKAAGDVLGIKLLDHIVFGINGYHSAVEHGEF